MAARDIFKISWKTFFNPAGWLDYEGLKNQNKTIFSSIKGLLTKPTPAHTETYEEAMKRLDVTDQDIQKAATSYKVYAFLLMLVGVTIFAYAFYLLFSQFLITGWLLGVAASALCLAQAFKYHFWAFQMRRRKLGATFSEWSRSFLGEKGTSI